MNFHQYTQQVQSLLNARNAFVIVTLVAARGSVPQIIGAKALVTRSGLVAGTVGGGKVEARAIGHAQQLLESAERTACSMATWNLQRELGMTCGGEVTLTFEVVDQQVWQVAVFGAGHVSQALVPMLVQLDCRVTCLDSRAAWLERLPPHPHLDIVHCERLEEHVKSLDPHSFFVVVTQGHATDVPILAEILTTTALEYVGVIGSRQKAGALRRELLKRDVPEDKLASLRCPIGLPLGNNTPPEIAISIAAQLIQVRDEAQRAKFDSGQLPSRHAT